MRRHRAVRRLFTTPTRLALAGSLVLVSLVSASGLAAGSDKSPRRCIPAKGLVAYVEYDGLDAHATAWQATAAHDILAKTSAGAMLSDLLRQVLDRGLAEDFGRLLTAADITGAAEILVRNGFAAANYGSLEEGVFVLRNAGRAENLPRFDGIRKTINLVCGGDLAESRIRGRTIYQYPGPTDRAGQKEARHDNDAATAKKTPSIRVSAWREGDDWIVVIDHVDEADPVQQLPAALPVDLLTRVLDAIDGHQPNVTTHPGLLSAVAEGKDLKSFEANGLFFWEQTDGPGPILLLGFAADELPDLLIGPVVGLFQAVSRHEYAPKAGTRPDTGTRPAPARKEDCPATASKDRPHDSPAPADGQAAADIASKLGMRVDAKTTPPRYPKPAGAPPKAGHLAPDAGAGAPEKGDEEFAFADLQREIAKDYGLDSVKRIVGRWGFQGRALVSDVRIEMPAPRRGLPALVEQRPFRTTRLPLVSPDASDFVLASFDAEQCYRNVVDMIMGADPEFAKLADAADALGIDPEMVNPFAEEEEFIRDLIGLRLRQDLLRHIGPTWALVNVPDRAGPPGDALKGRRKHAVLVASVDNADEFEKVLETLANRTNQGLRSFQEFARKRAPKGKEVAHLGMKRLSAPDRGYRIELPAFWYEDDRKPPLTLYPWKGSGFSVFVLIGKSSVALAGDLDQARAALPEHASGTPARSWKPSGELAHAIDGLPADLTFLSVSDPELCGLPDWIAGVPATIRSLVISKAGAEDQDNKTFWVLLNLANIARPGQFWPRFTRGATPRAEDLRGYMFSSVLATAVDDRGYRVIQRQPLPFAGLASEIRFHHRIGVDWKADPWPRVKFQFMAYLARCAWSN